LRPHSSLIHALLRPQHAHQLKVPFIGHSASTPTDHRCDGALAPCARVGASGLGASMYYVGDSVWDKEHAEALIPSAWKSAFLKPGFDCRLGCAFPHFRKHVLLSTARSSSLSHLLSPFRRGPPVNAIPGAAQYSSKPQTRGLSETSIESLKELLIPYRLGESDSNTHGVLAQIWRADSY